MKSINYVSWLLGAWVMIFALIVGAGHVNAQNRPEYCEPSDLLILLDHSGSMTSNNKWNDAVKALNTLIDNFGHKLQMGLIAFSSQSSLMVSVGPNNANAMRSALNRLRPEGTTAMKCALDDAYTHYATQVIPRDTLKERRRFVVLITDGMPNTCGTDVVPSVTKLRNVVVAGRSYDIKTFVIGFGSGVDGKQLQAMAQAGGTGNYYQANNLASLQQALDQIGHGASKEICNNIDDDCDGIIDDFSESCVGLCGTGTRHCKAGVWSACTTNRQPQPEICNNIDDDCNGLIDDGLERTCHSECGKGVEICKEGKWINCTAPQPQTEICNGKDDNCNGLIDENLTRPCQTACGKGTQACIQGDWSSCSAPLPSPEICDGTDNDCNGLIDELTPDCNGECIGGVCYTRCRNGECTGNQICKDDLCVPRPCQPECAAGQTCRSGRCVVDDCTLPGGECPANHICLNRQCIPDPCRGIQCAADQFCRDGLCIHSCEKISCPADQICRNGSCRTLPCKGKCQKSTESCINEQCVPNSCNACGHGQICQGNTCVDDRCLHIKCPEGQRCVDGECYGSSGPLPPYRPDGHIDQPVDGGNQTAPDRDPAYPYPDLGNNSPDAEQNVNPNSPKNDNNNPLHRSAGGCVCHMESSTSTGVHVFLLLALLLLPLFMRRSRSLFLGLFALTLIASAPRQAEASCETPNLLIVLDRSGSMSGSKWSTATQAINTITSNYDGKLRFGLITFHSAAEINYGLDACIRDGNNCVRNLQAALSSTKASGGTNLIAAINLAHSHLSTVIQQDSVKNRKNTVMFITDGIASCAHTQTQNLLNQLGVRTYIIGFGSGIDQNCLNNMATSGGTALAGARKYYQADNSSELNQAMKDIANAASEEICNGLDDDCDGYIDNIPGTKQNYNLTRPCKGPCGNGTQTCMPGGKWGACSTARQPEPEICDGIDNDCNGLIDDGLQRPCSNACGKGIETCVNGKWVNCTAPQPKPEICNNLDDDCNGLIDDGLKQACKSICGTGEETCINGKWVNCTAPQPEPEICDGKDNDCNGNIDDGLERPCQTICGIGKEVCINGQWVNCDGPKPEPEICDGKDNDCNGLIDDGLQRPCKSICGPGTEICVNGKWEQCDAPLPQTEACNGRDDDCNGIIDDIQPTPDCPRCVNGICHRLCTQECTAGFQCVDGVCVETDCRRVQCGHDQICRNGKCVGLCDHIDCGEDQICVKGSCVPKPANNDCTKIGCPGNQRCENGKCVTDPCAGVVCRGREYCRDGKCVETCADIVCNQGSTCIDGKCVEDACETKQCPNGQVCKDEQCIDIPKHPCFGVNCPDDQYCEDGKCIEDPCRHIVCPGMNQCYRGQCYGGVNPPPKKQPLPSPDEYQAPDGYTPAIDGGSNPDLSSQPQVPDNSLTDSKIGINPNTPDDPNTPPYRPQGCVCDIDSPQLPLTSLILIALLLIVTLRRRA